MQLFMEMLLKQSVLWFVLGYVDIEMLEQPDYNELEEFVVGSNGAEIFLKEH